MIIMKNYGIELAQLKLRTLYLSQKTLAYWFEQDFVNPKTGYSRPVTISELEKMNINFRTTNGGGWCRGDDAGYLGKRYNVVRIKNEDGRIIAVRTVGFKTE